MYLWNASSSLSTLSSTLNIDDSEAVVQSFVFVPGVIAVVTYGLYGAYSSTWDMDVHVLESGAFDSFYASLAFLVNGIIFFYSGVSCVNFVVR